MVAVLPPVVFLGVAAPACAASRMKAAAIRVFLIVLKNERLPPKPGYGTMLAEALLKVIYTVGMSGSFQPSR